MDWLWNKIAGGLQALGEGFMKAVEWLLGAIWNHVVRLFVAWVQALVEAFVAWFLEKLPDIIDALVDLAQGS